MKKYRGYSYFKDADGLWKVFLGDDKYYVVALDDRKFSGKREINNENNSELKCREYIDILSK